MPKHAIDVADLVREFKRGPRAVDGIDLYVEEGEIYGFLGPNGAGKSTTVRMLVTLLPPSGGKALVGGYDIARQGSQVRRVIGCALQEAALDPLLTAREHLQLQAGLHGFSPKEARARGADLLDRVGLSSAAERRVGTFSGGMKRRLDLALALVHEPKIIFLDEPTTGLDPQSRAALWEEVARLANDEGVTIFLTTQYLEEADALAARVGIIDRGHIVAEGTPAELKAEVGRSTIVVVTEHATDRQQAEEILLRFGELAPGSASTRNAVAVHLDGRGAGLTEVVRAFDSARIAVAQMALHAPTLDDVFLAKTGRSLEGEGAAGEAEPVLEPELTPEIAHASPQRFTTRVADALRLGDRAPKSLETPTLIVKEGPYAGRRIAIPERLQIGREGTDLDVDDPEISRQHALLRLVEGSLVIEDLRSLNGTWVNGRRITVPILLSAGDVIALGKTVMEVTAVPPDQAAARPAA